MAGERQTIDVAMVRAEDLVGRGAVDPTKSHMVLTPAEVASLPAGDPRLHPEKSAKHGRNALRDETAEERAARVAARPARPVEETEAYYAGAYETMSVAELEAEGAAVDAQRRQCAARSRAVSKALDVATARAAIQRELDGLSPEEQQAHLDRLEGEASAKLAQLRKALGRPDPHVVKPDGVASTAHVGTPR